MSGSLAMTAGIAVWASSRRATVSTVSRIRAKPASPRNKVSCMRRSRRSNCLASRFSEGSEDGRPAMFWVSSVCCSGDKAAQASDWANCSTVRRCGRTRKLSSVIAATSRCSRSATSPRRSKCFSFRSPSIWRACCASTVAISSTRLAKSFLVSESAEEPSVVSGVSLKNSRFRQKSKM